MAGQPASDDGLLPCLFSAARSDPTGTLYARGFDCAAAIYWKPMLDATPAKLTKTGTVTIDDDYVVICGFDGDGTSCRDMGALAIVWAIGRLQAELLGLMQKPGGGKIAVD